ncbi:uncharacterized protein AB675_6861 [Cyphellophora attinorum]|uniref:Wax synthase domain-containing protein n=1 Tax=Cyphellophora attinorum TaxID=1664694 RepID=A0A0N0NPV9_9EURO|nr:uncharacterized protein AB675_6861 [Phialophora attinorum]KPI43211.1 hypothetical protein AB675_6861 [Phialophora attinorum]
MDVFKSIWEQALTTEPRPGLHPIPGSRPLTIEAAICPPLIYYIALLFLAPPPPKSSDSTAIKLLRNVLALVAGTLFIRLPLVYHVPQSIGLTYQLGLVGIYGGCRVLDAFFISPYLFNHIPRRVHYKHVERPSNPRSPSFQLTKQWSNGGLKDAFLGVSETNGHVNGHTSSPSTKSSTSDNSTTPAANKTPRKPSFAAQATSALSATFAGPTPTPVYETAHTEEHYPQTFLARASWALELELSMRGIGFTWTTADVRHTRKTWIPTLGNRLHSLGFSAGPVLLVSWAFIRRTYVTYLQQYEDLPWTDRYGLFDTLPMNTQLLLTAALGAFLMAAFSAGHSMFAIMCHPLSPSPLSFFPPLYTTRVWEITSVRAFWSYGWHRLFARLFLVYGVWPGEWVERKLLGKGEDQSADIGKVIGAFASSAFVHAFSVRGVLNGEWRLAAGEARFFGLNGIAIVVEGVAIALVRKIRRRHGIEKGMWYDAWIGRVWWIGVLLWTGRNFARGWVAAGLTREMAFM